ncbi:hypothetical protein CYMTET_24696 [Cymbomonas tetramitiformis]|uniref:Uncharacterized protein n=1 Tax=Cymbomonas tetramitiformis TaxID=36881 RepID=A0AAE0FVE4_9CHLO|nr:hypothetical protein CYMTET_24696 [Cymbomonas tetramitiformis]
MADSDADAFTGTPVPPEIDAKRALTFSSGPEVPFPSTPAAGIPEGLTTPERDARAFVVDCKELLRNPGKQAESVLQIRERCRHAKQKTADWYFDYDTTKGQVAREHELARFTQSLVTVLTDHNPLFATVFDLTGIFAPVLPEASRLLFRIYELLARETVCGLGAEDIWGAGFAIDLLARRMCPVFYKDLLVKYDETTDERKKKRALGLVMFTLEVDSFHQQQSEAGALLKQKKKEDAAATLAASIISGESLTPATLAQLGVSRRHVEQLQGGRGHSARARDDGQSGVRDRGGGGRQAQTPTHTTPRHGLGPSQPGKGKGGRGKRTPAAGYRLGSHRLPTPAQTPHTGGRGRGSGGAEALRVTRDSPQGKHTVECWGCGGPHFLRDCPKEGRKPKAAAYMSDGTEVSLLLSTLDEIYAAEDDHSYGALVASHSLTLADEADPCDAALSAVILDDDYSALSGDQAGTVEDVADGGSEGSQEGDSDDEQVPSHLHVSMPAHVTQAPSQLAVSYAGNQPCPAPGYMTTICPPTEEFPGGVELIPVRHQPSAQPPTPPIPGQHQPQRYPRGPGQGSFGLGHLHTLTVLSLLCMATLPAVTAGSSVFQAAPDLQLRSLPGCGLLDCWLPLAVLPSPRTADRPPLGGMLSLGGAPGSNDRQYPNHHRLVTPVSFVPAWAITRCRPLGGLCLPSWHSRRIIRHPAYPWLVPGALAATAPGPVRADGGIVVDSGAACGMRGDLGSCTDVDYTRTVAFTTATSGSHRTDATVTFHLFGVCVQDGSIDHFVIPGAHYKKGARTLLSVRAMLALDFGSPDLLARTYTHLPTGRVYTILGTAIDYLWDEFVKQFCKI